MQPLTSNSRPSNSNTDLYLDNNIYLSLELTSGMDEWNGMELSGGRGETVWRFYIES